MTSTMAGATRAGGRRPGGAGRWRRRLAALAAPVLAACLLADPAAAQTEVPNGWVLAPSGLDPGDEFRLLFVTSTRRNAESSDIADYNGFVRGRAAAGHAAIQAHGSGFRVVGSTASVDARDNTSTTYTSADKGVPIYWLNGSKVADDYEDFYDGDWDDETGGRNESGGNVALGFDRIFTGSDDDGTAHSGRTLGASTSARVGIPGSTASGHNPIDGDTNTAVDAERRFYGLSGVFAISRTTTALAVTPTAVDVDEGGTATFTAVLAAEPPSDVTVTVASGAPGTVTVDTDSGTEGNQSTLTFTTTNWATARTVTVAAPDDEDADDATVTVTLSGTGAATRTVTVNVADNDPDACAQDAPAGAFWSDCLAVGQRTPDNDRHGFSSGGWGALADAASVAFEGGTYRISALRQAGGAAELHLDFHSAGAPDRAVGDDWILRVGDTDYPLAEAQYDAGEDRWSWASADGFTLPGWTGANVGDKVRVALTEVVSDDATLSALSLGAGVTLEPAFAGDVTEYRAWAGSASSVTVTATNNERDATVAIAGDTDATTPKTATLPLARGRTAVTVTVTAEDGTTTETYTVTAVREAAAPTADANALLTANVTVGEGAGGGAGAAGYGRVSALGDFGALTATGFTLDGNSRTVTLVALGEADAASTALRGRIGVCVPALAAADLARLFWRAGDSVFAFATATKAGDCYYHPRGALGWDYGDIVPFKIEKVPEVETATVNASTLALTFDKALDEASVPGAGAFAVRVTPQGGSQAARALASTDPVTVSGSTVTLALASPVLRSDAVTVSYTVPTGAGARPIRDATGHDAPAIADRSATNDSPSEDATLSALSLGAGVTLAPGFAADVTEYRAWVANGVSSVAVTATRNHDGATVAIAGDTDTSTPGTASLALSPGANTVTVTVRAANGITSRTYTVAAVREAGAPAADANALLTANITVGEGAGGGAGAAGYGRVSALGDFGALTATGFTLDGNSRTVTLVALGAADAASTALRGRIGVCVPALAAADLARLFWRAGNRLFAFSTATKAGDCYYHPRGALGWDYGDIVPFKIEKVPEVETATVNASSLALTFDKALDEASVPGAGAFAVRVTPRGGTQAARALAATDPVTVSGSTVTLALASPVALTDAVTLAYTVPTGAGARPIQDRTGHDAAGFTRATPDGLANRTPASTDAMLSALSLGSDGTLVPAFANDKREYRFWVANGVSSVTVRASRMHSGATVAIAGDSDTSTPETATQALSAGRNTVTVTVTAEDGSTAASYTVTVVREAAAPAADPDALLAASMTAGGDGVPGEGGDTLAGYADNPALGDFGALTGTGFAFRGARELRAVLLGAADASPPAIRGKFVACFASTLDLPWTYLDLDIGGAVLELYRATAVPGASACRYLDVPSGLTRWSYGDIVGVKVLRASRPPDAPTGLAAAKDATDRGTRINLSWTAPAVVGTSDIAGYRIEWSPDGSDGSWRDLVADTGNAETAYSNGGLASETTRHYRVSAINADGTGPASGTASATTDDILAPVLVSATVPAAGDRIALAFDDDLDPDETPPLAAFAVTGAGGAPVAVGGAAPSGQVLTLALAAGTPTLKAGETVAVAYAVPGGGATPLRDDAGNDAAGFATGEAGVPAVANDSTDPATAPASPGTLTAAGYSPSEIDLAWSPPAYHGGRAVTAYRIEHSDDGTTFATLVARHTTMRDGEIVTAYRHEGVQPNTTRYYRVSAINAVDTGAPSNVATGLALDPLGDVDLAVDPASAEEGGAVTWTVTATSRGADEPVADFDLEIRLTSADGTATAGRDYAVLDTTVNIRRGDFRQTVLPGTGTRWVARKTGSIAIVDDVEAETAESFSLSAGIVGTQSFYVAGSVRAEAGIAASDDWSLAFTVDPERLVEGAPREVTVSARLVPDTEDCVARFPIFLDLAVGGTATAPADYAIEPPTQREIAPCTGGTSWRIPIDAILDKEDDPGETIVFTPEIAGTPLLAPSAQPAPMTLTIDERPALVPSLSALSPDEGATASYTLALASRPTGPVTVTLIVVGDSDVTVSPARIAFTRDDWHVDRTVTVSADHDADRLDDSATVTHAAAGGGYDAAETSDVRVAVSDDDASFGVLTAHLSGGDPSKFDPPPKVHYGEAFAVELYWSELRTGHWSAPRNALAGGGAIRVQGGTARPARCPQARPSQRYCMHKQKLEIVPDGSDDVTLTLEPLDCRDNNPRALCALVNGRYSGLAARQSWTFRGIGGPPAAPSNLVLEEEVSTRSEQGVVVETWSALYAKFDTASGLDRWQVEARTPGVDWDGARRFEGPRHVGPQEWVRLEGLAVDARWDVRARWKNRFGWGDWAEARWTDAPLLAGPAGLAVAVGDDGRSVALTWTASASALRYQYRLLRGARRTPGDWRDIPRSGAGGANRSAFAVGGLADLWDLGVQLRAVDEAGRPGTASAEARPPYEAPHVLAERIAVTTNPGLDGRYSAGNLIALRVTMSRPVRLVDASAAPKVTLQIGTAQREATLRRVDQPGSAGVASGVDGSGVDLHFHTYVRPGDEDANGISIPAGGLRLDGARLVDATADGDGRAATFSLAEERLFPSHRVDGVARGFVVAERMGSHVWVHFDGDLDPGSRLDGGYARQFGVTFSRSRIPGHDITEARIVKGRGSQPCRSARAGSRAEEGCGTVRLTLGPVSRSRTGVPDPDETVRVSYTPIGGGAEGHPLAGNRLRDFVGNEVAAVTEQVAAYLGAGTTPQLSVEDATGREPVCADADFPGCTEARRERNVAFTVRLMPAATESVTVDYATLNGSAKAGEDYAATAGTLTFQTGETEKTVAVPILFDGRQDTGESFTLALANPAGAEIGDAEATGTIRNSEVALEAYFDALPAAHDGATAFTVRLAFSEEPAVDAEALRGAIAATGGRVTGASETRAGSRRVWDIAVAPDSDAAVTLALAPRADCDAEGAVCTEDSRGLAAEVRATVPGPARPASQVRVTSASLTSGPGANGVWDSGETVSAELRFGAPVTVAGGARPTLALLLDGARREAAYVGGSGTATLTFGYAVAAGDAGARTAGVASGGLTLNGATVEDEDGAAVDPAFSTAPWATGAAIVADESGDGVWTEGETLAVRLAFSEAVTVAGGPTVEIGLDGFPVPVPLTYSSGSGSAALVFSERIAGGAFRSPALAADSLRLRGGRIASTAAGRAAVLRHPGTGEAEAPRETQSETPSETPVPAPLTAEFAGMPAHHGGEPFTFELAFSESPALSYLTLRDRAIEVAGGRVTAAGRLNPPANVGWRITVEPDGTGEVTLTLPATADCDAAAAICTSDRRPLAAAVSALVPGEAPSGTPLTVRLADLPAAHDGENPVTFRVQFSRNPHRYSYRTLRDRTLEIRQGDGTLAARNAERLDPPRSDRWRITVDPASKADIAVAIAPTADCDAAGAVCAADGTMLSNAVSATIPGPPGLAVADARVREAAGATVDFAVTMSRAAASTVTVDYATSDGDARAGEDYRAASGTLAFAPGETAKTVSVPVLDDAHDDGGESFALALSNPQGGNAWLADAEAVGTIENSDAMPSAWLARFGRTVAEQVIDAVKSRFAASPGPGVEMTLAGERIGSGGDAASEEREARARLASVADWLRGADAAAGRGAGRSSRAVAPRELLTGSSFALAGEARSGGTISLWSRGALLGFEGREDRLALDGEVTSVMMGADWMRERWTAGLLVMRAAGEGGYTGPAAAGKAESTVTGVYPYARYRLNDRLTAWGAAGYGAGRLKLTPGEGAPMKTDMDLAMAAVGLRGVAVRAPAEGGLELSVASEATALRSASDAVRGGKGRLAEAKAMVTLLRLGVEGRWRGIETGGKGALEPSFSLALRHDSGDAETGFGVDAGIGLAWSHPPSGLSARIDARGLLTHAARGFRDRGLAASLGWNPNGSGRGPRFTLAQTLGGAASGGAAALLGQRHLGGLAANGDGGARRLTELRMGYGFRLPGGRFTLTPELALALSRTHREYALAWRLDPAGAAANALGLALTAARREPAGANGNAPPDHDIRLELTARW